jgi:Fur family transcriptional regulator, ferric uptake regulator
MLPLASPPPDVDALRDELRSRGLRWTPQRRMIVAAVVDAPDHVTGSELVERCRAIDPETTPSTVYRTLEVLEELGVVSHAHGLDGREEYHVRRVIDHAHLLCARCGGRAELVSTETDRLVGAVAEAHGFAVDVAHLSIVGTCAGCRQPDEAKEP